MPEYRMRPGDEILADGVRVKAVECRMGSVMLEFDVEPKPMPVYPPPVADAACDVRANSYYKALEEHDRRRMADIVWSQPQDDQPLQDKMRDELNGND